MLLRIGLAVGSSLPRLPLPLPSIPPLRPHPSGLHSRRRALLHRPPATQRPNTRSAHSSSAAKAAPPARKVPRKLAEHGDVRVDDYYWLRDDARADPDVLAHLRAENDYTAALMSDTKQLEDEIFAEIEENQGRRYKAPLRKQYYYYKRTLTARSMHSAVGVSPSGKLVAYAEDTKGDEIYTVFVIDAESGQYVGQPLKAITSDIEWAGDDNLVYITMDNILRPDKVWLHKLGCDQSDDTCLYHEKDDTFSLGLHASESKQYLFVGSGSKNTSCIFYLDIPNQSKELAVLTPRVDGIDTTASHPTGEAVGQLQGGRAIDFVDPAYAVEPEPSQFHSNVIRFYYSSMRVLGGFEVSNYVTERKWAAASDGTQIPMSVLYRKDMVKLDGSDPMLLYGYGSYEICIDPTFRGSRFSLVDRGFIYVIAHIRGGGEMGRNWYEDGKLMKKKNTFTDFIACAEHLIENKYCTKEKLCINGRSAGGLLMGAVLNMRPDLFKAAVAGVPFVDVLTTMLDPTIPLTTAEWELDIGWGDPRKEEYYYYMKSYSPVDNVTAQDYPHILVTAGLNDPRVMYSEPAKFVARLRELKTDNNLLLFKCELGAGHFSKSGRFEKLREDAFTYAFILKALGMTPPTAASSL
ncbi:hypothetical protein ZWY2020_000073 [Hordeum vulgare]|nr:hypothetical protein ZWY2020_000073 [Hordeum vulgare]